MDHNTLAAEHNEKFKNIEGDIAVLFKKEDDNQKHREESIEYRAKIDGLLNFRKELRVWFLGTILIVVGTLIWIGGKLYALDRLERLHPIESEQSYRK